MLITCHEINEVTGFSKVREILTEFQIVPIDYNCFWSLFTPKNCHVGDASRTRGGTIYRRIHVPCDYMRFGVNMYTKAM